MRPKTRALIGKIIVLVCESTIWKSGIACTELVEYPERNWPYSKLALFSSICNTQLRKSAQWSVITLQKLKNPFFNSQLIFSNTQELTVFLHSGHSTYEHVARKERKNPRGLGARHAMLCSSFYRLAQFYVLRHHAKYKNAIKSRLQTTRVMFNLFYRWVQTN